MHIEYFFKILPHIGFVILIAGIALAFLFLFCPMRYDIRASNADGIKGSIRLDFIFKIVSLEIFLKKKETLLTKIKLSLFGKALWQKRAKKKSQPQAPSQSVKADIKAPNTEDMGEANDKKGKKPNVRRIKMSQTKEPSPNGEKRPDTPSPKEEESEESLLKKIMKMPDKGRLISLSLKLIKSLFKEIKPDYVYIRGVLGTGDPCSTGRYMGIAYGVSGYFGLDTLITPDFENVVYKGKIRVTGTIRIYKVLYLGISFLTKKPVRNLIKILRKG